MPSSIKKPTRVMRGIPANALTAPPPTAPLKLGRAAPALERPARRNESCRAAPYLRRSRAPILAARGASARDAPRPDGLAQVNGRNMLPWPERVEFDLDYVERYSLWLDVKTLARTLPALMRIEGVYGEGGKVRMHHPA